MIAGSLRSTDILIIAAVPQLSFYLELLLFLWLLHLSVICFREPHYQRVKDIQSMSQIASRVQQNLALSKRIEALIQSWRIHSRCKETCYDNCTID